MENFHLNLLAQKTEPATQVYFQNLQTCGGEVEGAGGITSAFCSEKETALLPEQIKCRQLFAYIVFHIS